MVLLIRLILLLMGSVGLILSLLVEGTPRQDNVLILRGVNEDHLLYQVDLHHLEARPIEGADGYSFFMSPDHHWLYTTALSGRIHVYTGEKQVIRAVNTSAFLQEWSPDGQSALILVSADTAPPEFYLSSFARHNYHLLTVPGRWIDSNTEVTWSPDGQWLTIRLTPETEDGNDPANIQVLALDGREPIVLDSLGKFHSVVAWSPDSQWIYIEVLHDDPERYRTLVRYSISEDRYEEIAASLPNPAFVDFALNGSGIIVAAGDPGAYDLSLYIAEPGSPEVVPLVDEPVPFVPAGHSPDGQWLVLGTPLLGLGDLADYAVLNRASGEVTVMHDAAHTATTRPRWSPDSTWIMVATLPNLNYYPSDQPPLPAGVYRMHPDGSNVEALAADREPVLVSQLRVQGAQMVYLVDGQQQQLHLMNVDGTDDRILTLPDCCYNVIAWAMPRYHPRHTEPMVGLSLLLILSSFVIPRYTFLSWKTMTTDKNMKRVWPETVPGG